MPDGYGMSVAFTALLDAVKGVSSVVNSEMDTEEKLWQSQPNVGNLTQAIKMEKVNKGQYQLPRLHPNVWNNGIYSSVFLGGGYWGWR